MFRDVQQMNVAFGNSEGNYANPNWPRLESQCKNILDEYNELVEALDFRDPVAVRDALCDIMVFTLGVYHLLGANADADMRAVFESNMSKFCRNQEVLDATIKKYDALSVRSYVGGEFPVKYLKSSYDQQDLNGENYPANKFLKSTEYQAPLLVDPLVVKSNRAQTEVLLKSGVRRVSVMDECYAILETRRVLLLEPLSGCPEIPIGSEGTVIDTGGSHSNLELKVQFDSGQVVEEDCHKFAWHLQDRP